MDASTKSRAARATVATLAVLILSAACYEEPVAIRTFPPERTPLGGTTAPPRPTPTISGTPTSTPLPLSTPTIAPPSPETPSPVAASPSPRVTLPTPTGSPVAAFGTPSPGCVNGWISPAPTDPTYIEGLAILSDHMGVTGPWSVTEMRYFVGPEVPWILSNPNPVERWYIRAALVDDPTFRGRWLVEKRSEEVLGVSAVAPWDSTGYVSPDWTGFFGEGPPQTYIGLPGQWSGIAYNFVTGEGDSGNPGLPAQVVDCLSAT